MPDTCRTQLAMRHRTSPSRRHLRDTPRPFSTPSDGRVASTNRRWPRGSLPRHLPFRHHSDRHPALRSRSNSPSPPLARPERHLSLEDDSLGELPKRVGPNRPTRFFTGRAPETRIGTRGEASASSLTLSHRHRRMGEWVREVDRMGPSRSAALECSLFSLTRFRAPSRVFIGLRT